MKTAKSPFNFLMILVGFVLLLTNIPLVIALGILLLIGGLLAPFYQDALHHVIRRKSRLRISANQNEENKAEASGDTISQALASGTTLLDGNKGTKDHADACPDI